MSVLYCADVFRIQGSPSTIRGRYGFIFPNLTGISGFVSIQLDAICTTKFLSYSSI